MVDFFVKSFDDCRSQGVALRGAVHCSGRTGGWLQMNQLNLRNNWLKFETSRRIINHFRGIYRIYLK